MEKYVREHFACPVCSELMELPIPQCPNGHTICRKCKSKATGRCPICHSKIGNGRCLALEEIAERIQVPCKHRSLGCQHISPYPTRLGHELYCHFRPYNCPHAHGGCPVTGDIPHLVAHLQSDHKDDMQDGPTFTHTYFIPYDSLQGTWKLTVFNCYDYQFCLHFEAVGLGDSPMYMAFIRFMGREEDAVKFRYSLEVVIGSDRGKLKWEGRPRSIRESHAKVRDSFEGLLIHPSMATAQSLSGGNNKQLKITGRISTYVH